MPGLLRRVDSRLLGILNALLRLCLSFFRLILRLSDRVLRRFAGVVELLLRFIADGGDLT